MIMPNHIDAEAHERLLEKYNITRGALWDVESQRWNRGRRRYLEELFGDDPQAALLPTDHLRSHIIYPLQEGKYHIGGSRLLYGGIDGFFAPGSHVLDMGSGGGKAVAEFNEEYRSRGVIVRGMDLSYGEWPSEYASPEWRFIWADWRRMPFQKDSFNRLLSYDSFYTYPQSGFKEGEATKNEAVSLVLDEITRVAKPGAIWRGFSSKLYLAEEETDGIEQVKQLREYLSQKGWEVKFLICCKMHLGQVNFVARLKAD